MKKKRVGDYELLDTLGSGTFGKVRRARHIITEKEYAVKCIDKTMLEKQKMRTQLKREISIAKLIQHPRVVQLFEVLASKTKIYLVLELVTGGELFDLLAKEKVFGEVKARHFFKQLVDGMICCHEKGICHRDVKPENLLLDSNGDLKISDFGLSGLHDCNCGDATLTQSKMLYTSKWNARSACIFLSYNLTLACYTINDSMWHTLLCIARGHRRQRLRWKEGRYMVHGSGALCNDNRHVAISCDSSSRLVLNNSRRKVQEPTEWREPILQRLDIQDFSY